jgi:hypothetical protein
MFLISNFRRVLNVVHFLLGDSPAYVVYWTCYGAVNILQCSELVNFFKLCMVRGVLFWVYLI